MANRLPRTRTSVCASNDAATSETVFDIIAEDVPGILCDIATFFHREDLSVQLARVATEGRAIHDTFYAVDLDGAKLDADTAVNVAEKLRAWIDRDHTPHSNAG